MLATQDQVFERVKSCLVDALGRGLQFLSLLVAGIGLAVVVLLVLSSRYGPVAVPHAIIPDRLPKQFAGDLIDTALNGTHAEAHAARDGANTRLTNP